MVPRLRGRSLVGVDEALQSVRVPLDSCLTPADAVRWLRGDPRPFALVGDWLGGSTLLGSDPVRIADGDDDPFAAIEAMPAVEGEATVGGGWVGWLSYGLGARIERLPPPPPARVVRPPFSLAFYDHVVQFDGERWWFEALVSPAREDALRERCELWRARLQTGPPPSRPAVTTPFAVVSNGEAGHLAAVADCRRRIVAGEIYQANVCLRLEAELEGELLDLFGRALERAAPRFGALVDGTLSLSPERFLRRDGRIVSTEPIKGTAPRGGDEHARRAAREALLASTKDAAEHVMIVDLMRNDLGRVCDYGTISVDPARIEAHAGVWHLVSTVSGRLREGVGDGALLRATFPPGSVTGAPKVQAMKVIATLEATRRELYTGAIGIVSPVAGLDLSVVIRTFEAAAGRIWFGAGGGIVADSEPELELNEALVKASGPVAAIGGRVVSDPSRAVRRRVPARAALEYGSRPDPEQGVFETVLVQRGQPVALEAHLARLAGSLTELYEVELDPAAEDRARTAAAAAGTERARLRILADPFGGLEVTVSEAGARGHEPAQLMPYVLPGGLGRHKWRDRRLLEALTARGAVPLLVDTDGLVLEAAYANVWIAEGGQLLTPPADGRILPGITRAVILETEPGAREEPIELARLGRAEAVFLTSSISGRHPALITRSR
jgi:para-aminobenzoate synthetase / 4-amino-4-deoxychorismate lyase